MKTKFNITKKIDELKSKGINTVRLSKNSTFLVIFTVLLVLIISGIIQQIAFYNQHMKDSEECQVKIISNLGYVHYADDFPDWYEAEIVDTKEEVNTTLSLNIMDKTLLQKYYPIHSEFDAKYFYYEGDTLVHLENSMFLILLNIVCISIMFLCVILSIIFTTLYRIKNVGNRNTIWLTKKRSRLIRLLVLAVTIAISSLGYLINNDTLWFLNFAPFTVLLYTIPLVTFFMTHHDYYIESPADATEVK